MDKSPFSTECDICLEDMVEPRALPCGHTYCKTCLQQIIDSAKNIRCPSDRKVFNVPEGNVDNLARNYYLENMLENVRTSRTAKVATVTCVDHADKAAEVFCESCLKSVCSKCVLKHNGHELNEYSDSRDKCALRIQQLQADVRKFKQAVDDANSAKTSDLEAQVAACKRKVDAAVNKIREIVQVLNAAADCLQSKTAMWQQLTQTPCIRLVDFESFQRDVADLSETVLSFTDNDSDTGNNCKLEDRFQQVAELTQKLEVQRGKLASVTSRSVPDVSVWFSDNELTHSLETVFNYAVILKQNLTSDTNDYLSLQQLKAALKEATTVVQTSTSASTQRAALLQTNPQPLAVQWAAASNADVAPNLLSPAQTSLQQKQIIVLAGGWGNDGDTLAYDISSETWTTVASMSGQRYEAGAALLQSKFVVAGGSNQTNQYLKTVEQFDPESNSWTALPELLHHRTGLAMACLDNTLYTIGGADRSRNCLSSVERFDPNTNRWQLAAPLNAGRTSLCCTVLRAGILAIGGWNGSKRLGTCELFDGVKKKWQFVAPLQTARSHAAASTVDDRVYVFGGRDNDRKDLNTVEEYAVGKWTLVQHRLTVARWLPAVATVYGRVYVCGGYPDGKVVDCFNAFKWRISRVAGLTENVCGAAAAFVSVSETAWSRLFSNSSSRSESETVQHGPQVNVHYTAV